MWKAHPCPDIGLPKRPSRANLIPYANRCFAAVVRHYLDRAGLPIPTKIEDMLAEQNPDAPVILPFVQQKSPHPRAA